jgi:hypothetical protein
MAKEEVRHWISQHIEVIANLDQNPQVQQHYGHLMPTLLASMSNIFALLRNRVVTSKVARLHILVIFVVIVRIMNHTLCASLG